MKKYKSLLDAIGLKQLLDGTSFPRFSERNVQAHIHCPVQAAIMRQSIIGLKHDLSLLCIISAEKYDSHFNAIGLSNYQMTHPFPDSMKGMHKLMFMPSSFSYQGTEPNCFET
jgi:hypothetical protein